MGKEKRVDSDGSDAYDSDRIDLMSELDDSKLEAVNSKIAHL